MYDVINGYRLMGEFRNDNSGFSRWSFAYKDGIEVFIKEFLSPVYPVDIKGLPADIIANRIELCSNYVAEKNKLYDALNQCNTGNVVGIADFFRYKAKYYIVTEKINALPITIDDIAQMPVEQKHLICKIITHCLNTLHKHNIVHGDVKHDNILYKKTPKGKYIAKLIDFDASFFADSPPDPDEEFHGDMVYFAPESFLYIIGETTGIDMKIDVFALGLLFHQYFTGKLPAFDNNEYDYAFEAVLDGNILVCDNGVPEKYRSIIESMLVIDSTKRPELEEIFERFSLIDGSAEKKTDVPANETTPENKTEKPDGTATDTISEDKTDKPADSISVPTSRLKSTMRTKKPEVESFGFFMAGDL